MALFICKGAFKKGSLYEMTSNNTPTPFVASIGQDTNVSISGQVYTVFRSEGGSVTGTLRNSGDQAYLWLDFNKNIKVKKLHYKIRTTGSAFIFAQVKDINGNYTPAAQVVSSGEHEGDIVFPNAVNANRVVLGIRIEADNQIGFALKQLLVTEWR